MRVSHPRDSIDATDGHTRTRQEAATSRAAEVRARSKSRWLRGGACCDSMRRVDVEAYPTKGGRLSCVCVCAGTNGLMTHQNANVCFTQQRAALFAHSTVLASTTLVLVCS
jgi:hypothetical protein